MDASWGPGWGIAGLRGFLLSGEAYNAEAYLLFLSALPAVTTAVLVTVLSLVKHVTAPYLFVIGLLISALIYPLFGNWVWGGGWLANVGLSLNLGHGFVDAAGSGTVFALGSLVALGAYLRLKPRLHVEDGPPQLPPIHFPLFAIAGTFLALVGWVALLLGNPLTGELVVSPFAVANLLLSATGAALVVLLYSWFVTGQSDALAAGRATVAGLVAASASCAVVPAWAALAIGGVAGLLLLAGLYIWEQVLRLDDPGGSFATCGLPGLWGLLAVGVFADGRWGAGWNGVGAQQYLGIPGQGVSGLLVASGYQPGGVLQLQAQLVGIAALVALGAVVPWLVFEAARLVSALGQPGAGSPGTLLEESEKGEHSLPIDEDVESSVADLSSEADEAMAPSDPE
jgi:Amt family ammonium transporter